MMSWFRFAIFYFTISALGCALVGMPIFVRSFEYGTLGFGQQAALSMVLTLFIPAGLLSISFKVLNGGVKLRRVSAIVLVFFLSIVGIAVSSVIGAAFAFAGSFLLRWLSVVLNIADVPVLKYLYTAMSYVSVAHIFTGSPSFSMVAIFAVFGSFFGLPLARIAKGSRLTDVWHQQNGKRWLLFWQSGVGVLGLLIIWTATNAAAYLAFIEPTLPEPIIPDDGVSLLQGMLRQPSLLEISFSFGMNLLLVSLAAGVVASFSEQVRREFG